MAPMGLMGDAYDNAHAASFVATLKTEQLPRYLWVQEGRRGARDL